MSIQDWLLPEGGSNIDVGETASALAALLGITQADVEDIEIPVQAELPAYVPWLAGGIIVSLLLVAFRK